MSVLQLPRQGLESSGYCILRAVVSAAQMEQLSTAVESYRKSHTAPGLRNLLSQCDAVRDFAHSQVMFGIAEESLTGLPHPVRAILFDKTPASNWYVTWHQDLSIPVKAKCDAPGYGPWSTKDGIVHVQPPASILEQMISLRVHLDDCAEENGAIKFISGSHTGGILAPDRIAHWRDNHPHTICPAGRGDVIFMRPLILHSSSTSSLPDRRRVLHIEYTCADLPVGMEWAEA